MGDPSLSLSASPLVSTDITWGDIWASFFWVLGLLGVNAFFVAVEFSLVSTRRSRLLQLASEGSRQAVLVQKAQENLEKSLSTTQLGITVASVLLGWIGATRVAQIVAALLHHLPSASSWSEGGIQWAALLISFILLTYLQIVWGELLPKTVAIVYGEPIALRLARLNHLVSRLLAVFVEVPRFSSRLILHLLRVPLPDSARLYSTMTAEELQLLIASSPETGIEEEERELLANIFEFGETVASEVMIPRTSIDAVSEAATVQDVLAEVAESGHSRYPAYGESLDDIRGLVNVKDLIAGLAKNSLTLDSSIRSYIRPAHFEHENKLIAELLPEMQQHHRTMVVVVDEFGGTAGLITIQDLVEEIVGKLSDEPATGDHEPDIQVIDENTLIVQAQLDIEEVSERLDFDLPVHDDYQTLGGFLIYQMQKIPRVGEKLTYLGWEFQVVKIEGPRLDRIKITRPSHLTNPEHPDVELSTLSRSNGSQA
ncbi:MAG: hemolysin family protein [Cyanobacteriota bacterium]|nr:hemolysin family protein [Cyanobacteriota bacterium]